MKHTSTLCSLAAVLGSLFITVAPARAQGTAFTYQGRLDSDGVPASGIFDLRFTIFNLSAGGAPVAGPITNSPAAVSNGLFTATLDFGANFPGADRWLEIGVRTNGGGAFATLSPRQALTASPYSITAGNVTGPINGSSIIGGTITSAQLATGAVTALNIASNSITSGQLASGAAVANLQASGQSGVPSGGAILSADPSSTNLANAGYVKIAAIEPVAWAWAWAEQSGPPAARRSHTAVWTGSEMIVWGGDNGSIFLNDGSRYNPSANSWTATPTTGAPAARRQHTAVWTGSEMIVWGGFNGSISFSDGSHYNPSANSWTATATTGALAARHLHTAVWTGSEMIVWGGQSGESPFNDGGRYDPLPRTIYIYVKP